MLQTVIILVALIVTERVFCQHHVCLTKQIVDGTLTLNCSVDKLQFPIYFYTPTNTEIGKCAAPQVNTLKIIRCDENVMQYLDTNTTSLTINISSYNVSGIWTCAHGLFKENINIEVLQCPQNKDVWDYSVVLCISLIIILSGNLMLRHQKDSRSKDYFMEESISKNENIPHLLRFRYHQNIEMNNDNKAIRLCGIVILPDSRIILGDYFNQSLIICKDFKFQFNFSLENEPRGMTGMTENKIAVTYAFSREIVILAIHDNHVTVVNKLDMHLGKPFSIAYDEYQFAVEVGEGDDGRIAIIHSDGRILRTISNVTNFAYFTGNTIRLAFDAKRENVIIAAMSKNLVTCLDFDGKVIWSTVIQSPRGLVFLTDSTSRKEKLLLASKRCSTIYELNLDNGRDKVLLAAGKIKGPRYMAYYNKLLCIQNDGDAILTYYFYDKE